MSSSTGFTRTESGLMFGEASAVFEKANNRTSTQYFFCLYKNLKKPKKNKHILSEVTFFSEIPWFIFGFIIFMLLELTGFVFCSLGSLTMVSPCLFICSAAAVVHKLSCESLTKNIFGRKWKEEGKKAK